MDRLELDVSTFKDNSLRILELNDSIAAHVRSHCAQEHTDVEDSKPSKRRRSKMRIVGDGERAFLCTGAKGSFQLRRVEYSNSLLIVKDHSVITAKVPFLFEAISARPPFELVDRLLHPSRVTLSELHGNVEVVPSRKDCWSLRALHKALPMDKDVIAQYLSTTSCISVGGVIRPLDAEVVRELVTALCTYFDPLLNAPVLRGDLINHFEDAFHAPSFEAVLNAHCERHEPREEDQSGEARFSLNVSKVAAIIGLTMLRSSNGKAPLDDFEERWRSRYSFFHNVSVAEHLKGDAIVIDYGTGQGNMAVAFPHATLPFDPTKRVLALFAVKPRWALDELQAYLAPLDMERKDVEMLLTKVCREHRTEQGSRYALI